MIFRVVWSENAAKSFARLDNSVRKRIKDYLYDKSLLENPKSRGKDLSGEFAGFRRYRVGDYRIIVKIRDCEIIIYVLAVGHRSKIYE